MAVIVFRIPLTDTNTKQSLGVVENDLFIMRGRCLVTGLFGHQVNTRGAHEPQDRDVHTALFIERNRPGATAWHLHGGDTRAAATGCHLSANCDPDLSALATRWCVRRAARRNRSVGAGNSPEKRYLDRLA